MIDKNAENVIRSIFDSAGIGVRGERPGDIEVKRPEFYGRLLRDASIGLGESYMDEWWECEALDLFIEKLLRVDIKEKIKGSFRMKLFAVRALLANMQSPARSKRSVEMHYDIGNDLYEIMLDARMVYTCGYWRGASSLDQAQENKLDLICRKAGLEPGMRVLDLGCGFGGFAMFAAERYGCDVTGFTISREQHAWGVAEAKRKGLDRVHLRLADYREAAGRFDRVVSIGMLEHVGWRNHRTFMEVVHRNLRDDGIAVIHTIGSNVSQRHGIPFFEKYLFPNAASPSMAQLGRAAESLFAIEDVHNIGPDYRPTLLAWWSRFSAGYDGLDHARYNRRFYRLWRFYLLSAAGAVAARESQLWHLVLTKIGRAQPECRLS